MTFIQNITFLAILDQIQGFIQPYIDMVLDFINGSSIWLQAGIIVGIAIFAIIGIFVFIKKFIKLFIGLAILGVVVYFVWTKTTIIQDLLSGITGMITNIQAFLG